MNTIVAAFRSAAAGRGAADALRSAGFAHVTAERVRAVLRSAPAMRESGLRSKYEFFLIGDDDSLTARVGRLLSGAGSGRPVYERLVRLGVSDREARATIDALVDESLRLTIESDGLGERIRRLIEAAGGRVFAGMSKLPVLYDDYVVSMPQKPGVSRPIDAGRNDV